MHRDRTYLKMDEEQKAKRLFVISKITREGWIKTEAQAMIDRAKVKPPCPACPQAAASMRPFASLTSLHANHVTKETII